MTHISYVKFKSSSGIYIFSEMYLNEEIQYFYII